jgi:hypothetical protein
MPPTDDLPSTSATMRAPLTFFDLPAEVRNIIYRLLFPKRCWGIEPRVLAVLSDESEDEVEYPPYHHIHKPASSLRTSKSFNVEASPFVYGATSFYFSTLSHGIYFLEHIGKQNAIYITGLRMRSLWLVEREASSPGFKDALEAKCQCLAERCPRLRSLSIGCLGVSGAKKEWKIAVLGYLKILIDALPRLSDVRYDRHNRRLYFRLPTDAVLDDDVRLSAYYLESYY